MAANILTMNFLRKLLLSLVYIPLACRAEFFHERECRTEFSRIGFDDFQFQVKIEKGIPHWIEKQIDRDLDHHRRFPVSLKRLNLLFERHGFELLLIKVNIQNNQVTFEREFTGQDRRVGRFIDALIQLTRLVRLPNTTFLISLHDRLEINEGLPIFAISKRRHWKQVILIPDFEIVECCAAINGIDSERFKSSWKKKRAKLFWRGTAISRNEFELNSEHVCFLTRERLLGLADRFPHLIDARFLTQDCEHFSHLRHERGEWLGFDKQIRFKYHILLDSNSCAFSASPWKFFSNSLIFKPDSDWIQWYYAKLKPFVHFVPVKHDLDDLPAKIEWAKAHDSEAKAIARKARKFALEHLTMADHLAYLYFVINKYSQLNFIAEGDRDNRSESSREL